MIELFAAGLFLGCLIFFVYKFMITTFRYINEMAEHSVNIRYELKNVEREIEKTKNWIKLPDVPESSLRNLIGNDTHKTKISIPETKKVDKGDYVAVNLENEDFPKIGVVKKVKINKCLVDFSVGETGFDSLFDNKESNKTKKWIDIDNII